jgi:hypothetical protein
MFNDKASQESQSSLWEHQKGETMITFTRQQDGTYKREGELASQRVQIQIEDQTPFGIYDLAEAVAFLEDAIAKSQVKMSQYSIVPLEAKPMPEEVKQKFSEIRREQAKEPRMIMCAHEGCQETYPRTRGRYPQRFCAVHRSSKAVVSDDSQQLPLFSEQRQLS